MLRVYVISVLDGYECSEIKCLRSNRKDTIATCEELIPDGHWVDLTKHKGVYSNGKATAYFQMYYVNKSVEASKAE